MNIFKPVDMTQGNPGKQIVAFTLPMLIGNIAQQLYNTVDSIIVGRFVGDNALAAVGSAFPVLNLLFVLIAGISTGAGIMVSQYFGARQREKLTQSISVCIFATVVGSLVVMLLIPPISMPFLKMLNTPEDIILWCDQYLNILLWGFLGNALYNILSGILRGLGDSASALLYLLVATGLNIVGDYVFVAYFNMGVVGVALATVIAQAVSAVLCMRKLMNMREYFDLSWRDLIHPDMGQVKELLRLGLPSGVTQLIFSMSMVVVQRLSNSFGAQFVAANVIIMRIDGFVMMPCFSFGMAMTTFAGQNIGAGRMDRLKQGLKEGTLIAGSISVVLTILIVLFGRHLMGIFTETQALIELAYRLMVILAPGYVAMEINQCFGGVMRGAGDTMTPMWISLINMVAIRVPLAYIMVGLTRTAENPVGDSSMMMWSNLISWITGMLLTLIFFKIGKWKTKALTGMQMAGVSAES